MMRRRMSAFSNNYKKKKIGIEEVEIREEKVETSPKWNIM
jgi:hypothetical protein